METSTSIGALAAALAKAQSNIKGALKDSSNPFFKSKYADLSSVWEACREPLTKQELSVIQTVSGDSTNIIVTTMLVHSSGEWVKDSLTMAPVKQDPQGAGSAITYARRYALAAIAGVAPEDDDGNAASGKGGNDLKPTAKTNLTKAQKDQVYADSIKYLENGDEQGLRETWHGFDADEKVVLWGLFNSEQRSAMKKILHDVRAA